MDGDTDFDPGMESDFKPLPGTGGGNWSDVFLSKLNPNEAYPNFYAYEWTRVWGGDSEDKAYDVSCAPGDGGPTVVGYWRSSEVDFDYGGLGDTRIMPRNPGDSVMDHCFVVKSGVDGVYQWALTSGGRLDDRATCIAYRDDGSLAYGGYVQPNADTDLDPFPDGTDWYYVPGGWGISCSFATKLAAPEIGDLNCDGAVNFFDIDAFVAALLATPPDYAEYYQDYPGCDHLLADCNDDGNVNFFDIDPFVAILLGS